MSYTKEFFEELTEFINKDRRTISEKETKKLEKLAETIIQNPNDFNWKNLSNQNYLAYPSKKHLAVFYKDELHVGKLFTNSLIVRIGKQVGRAYQEINI